MAMKVVLLISCLLALQVVADVKVSEIPRKKLAGPPSEFKHHEVPTPLHGALVEDSIYIPVTLEAKNVRCRSFHISDYIRKIKPKPN